MTKLSGIYAIINLRNGNRYVGSSHDIAYRWRKHRETLRRGTHHSQYLQRSFIKHGEGAFLFMMLECVEPPALQDVEQRYLDSGMYVYNACKSARTPNPSGGRLPERWRVNAANAFIEKFVRKIRSGEIVHPRRGVPLSEETKEKLRQTSRAMWQRGDREKLIASARNGIDRKQRSDTAKKLWTDPSYRAKRRAAMVGRATNKGYKCTPEQVANRRRAARISNMKRNYGEQWRVEYVTRYPALAHEVRQ